MHIEAKLPQIKVRAFSGCIPLPMSKMAPATVPRDMLPDDNFVKRFMVLCKFVCVKSPKMRGMGVYRYERMWSISRYRQQMLQPDVVQAGMMQHGKARLL